MSAGAHGCGFLSFRETASLADDRLAPERSREFRAHVESGCLPCALLAADLETWRDVVEGSIGAEEREEFSARKEMLGRRLRREMAGRSDRAERARRPRLFYRGLAAAAAVFVTVLAVTVMLHDPGLPGSMVTLPDGGSWEVEAMPFRPPPTLRGEPDRADWWKLAGEAYAAGDYREAEEWLARIDDTDAALYRGACLHLLGEYAAAVDVLARARRSAETEDLPVGAITWYQGLALLGLGEVESAREALETCRDAGGAYAVEAGELLEALGGLPPSH